MKKNPIVPVEQRTKYDRWHFSPAVESGGFLFVSGCTGALVEVKVTARA